MSTSFLAGTKVLYQVPQFFISPFFMVHKLTNLSFLLLACLLACLSRAEPTWLRFFFPYGLIPEKCGVETRRDETAG